METQTEKVFYQDANVSVTQSRFVASSKTYAMRNISSVHLYRKERSKKLEIILIIIGSILLIGESSRIVGAIMLIAGLLLLFLLKDEYTVRINSNSGEADGYVSKDKELIQKIVNAVNEAMIFRG
jgi:type IV secretory pathway component VirB8